jgi:hypothetical protein
MDEIGVIQELTTHLAVSSNPPLAELATRTALVVELA